MICEPGFYCQSGRKHSCPAGSFGETSGMFFMHKGDSFSEDGTYLQDEVSTQDIKDDAALQLIDPFFCSGFVCFLKFK